MPIETASEIVDLNPKSSRFRVVRGALLDRGGRHAEAIEHLTEVARDFEGPQQGAEIWLAYTWHFLGMAHMATGDVDESRQYLTKAHRWMDQALNNQEEPLLWYQRATLELFCREAESVLKGFAEEFDVTDQKPKSVPVSPEGIEPSSQG